MASSFAQGFRMGGDMYSSAERMKLAQEQQEWAREEALAKRGERQREADIRTAGIETYGRVGQPSAFMTAGGAMGPAQPTEAQNRLADDEYYRNMGGRQSQAVEENLGVALPKGDAAKMFPKQEMYTQEQADKDYLRRLRGLDVGKAQQFEKGALELGELNRAARYSKNQELALGFNNSVIQDLTEANGDAASVIEKRFIPLYNADKLDGFKDGGRAKIVPSAVGGDKSIVITYKDGKQETMPADMKTLQELTNYTQDKMMRSSTPENYWKAKTQALEERKTAATESSAASSAISAGATAQNAATNAKQLDAQIKAGLFEAQAGQARASAASSTAHAAVYRNMAELYKSNKEAGEAVKPYLARYEALTDKERDGPAGQRILEEGALAAAKKSTDVTALINTLKKADKSQAPEIDPKLKEAAYKEYSEAGTDPKALAAIKAKYPGVFGQSALDKALSGKAAPTETAVEGRPFYNKTNDELLRMTKRAIGTSTSEAREAQAELDARKGESRMKAF